MICTWIKNTVLFLCISLLCTQTTRANTTSVPLNNAAAWIDLRYSSIPANTVTHSANGLKLSVNNSASPLIHQLASPMMVNKVNVQARVVGGLNLDKAKQQGDKGNDDFIFRVGFVTAGKKRLSVWQKPFAAQWIKQLFALAPKNSGIDKILFLNVPDDPDLTGTNRIHPASDLLHEWMLAPAKADGTIDMQHTFAEPLEIVALWISSDGDDTQSQYEIEISNISLHNQ